MTPGAQVEHPSSANLSGTMQSKALLEAGEVIGRSSRGMGMLNLRWYLSETMVGSATATK